MKRDATRASEATGDEALVVDQRPSRGSALGVRAMSADDLVALTEPDERLRVSLYLPVPRGSSRAKRGIQWKNLVRAVARQLAADGVPPGEVTSTLQAAADAFDHADNGGAQDGGWAYFADPRWSRAMHLPIRVPLLAVVGDRCRVAPLLPLLSYDDHYYVLGLSRDDLQLYAGTRVSLARVPLEGSSLGPLSTMPRERRPAGAFVADRGDSGSRGLLHGVGGTTEIDQQHDIVEYFRRVDAAVVDVLGSGSPPLILGGVGYLHALYRQVNSYPHLLDEGISGGLADLAPVQLHARTWPIAESALQHGQRRAIGRFKLLHGTGRTVTEPQAAAAAADEGRIEVLLVSVDTSGEAATSDVVVERLRGASLCVEAAIAATLRNGGAVHAVHPGQMPVPTPAAGVLRY